DFLGPTDLTKIADDYSDEKKALYYSASSFPSIFVNGVTVYKDRKGGSVLDTPETANDANPLNYVSKNAPPFLIFHGDSDKTVSPSQSKILHNALIKTEQTQLSISSRAENMTQNISISRKF
ncbi:MAG: prolyl oligopeptidase family serine peptidase, partial [Synergistaceae bacterium]|nr:prolyl oligopeptidase family serine peptidase [Synergistaceae bacterium]